RPTNRKAFLKKAGLAATSTMLGASLLECRRGGSSASSGPVIHVPGQTFEWKMVTTWPRDFPALGTGANQLAQNLETMSGGRLRVKIFAAGEMVPALEVFDAVHNGTAEIGHGAAYYWKGKTEAAQFFAAVPFGLNAQEMNGWIHYGGGQELWDELYADFGLKPFATGNTGVQMGGWFNKEINTLSDFQGLIMRMPGLGGEVLRQVGAAAPNIPGGEIFQSLQSGAIDATEWVGPFNDLAFGFYKAARYYYWPGWHEPGTALELIVNRRAFEALPDDLKQVIQSACKAAYTDMLGEFTARNNLALETLVLKHKVQLRKFSDEILRKLGTISQDVVADIARRDPAAGKIYESYLKFRSQAVEWSRIGEEGFSLARELSARSNT
ncbi:MAG: TRAP transporter substrate-binding protein, partial [Leptospiraceae bacterium]|nr:TRAP transporter substrate-binding protein [Leptospiraceae bacterium]